MPRKALLLGRNGDGSLRWCCNYDSRVGDEHGLGPCDVRKMRDALARRGWGLEHISVVGQDCQTEGQLVDRIDSALEACAGEDHFLFYFSGHASYKDGALRLILDGGKPQRTYPASKLIEQLQACRAATKLLILDCCYAEDAADVWLPRRYDNLRILVSTKSLVRAKEIDGLDGGIFTHCLCEALTDEAHWRLCGADALVDADGAIYSDRLLRWLKSHIPIVGRQYVRDASFSFPEPIGDSGQDEPFLIAEVPIPSLAASSAGWPSDLSRVGVQAICRQQVEHVVKRLIRGRKFDPNWHVVRQRAIDGALAFLDSAYPVLAIVGDSNVGKTWLLADLALNALPGPSILLQSAALDRNTPQPLSVLMRDAIHEACEDLRSFPTSAGAPDGERIAAACARDSPPLVVLLDGINEALDVRGFLKDWLAEAIGWCREHGVRLIVSSRPEPWPMIVRAIPEPLPTLYWQPPARETDVEPTGPGLPESPDEHHIRLADFSVDEAGLARERYGIALDLNDAIGRHPLMYRVARDLGSDSIDAACGRFRLLDRFIAHHIDDAAGGSSALSRALAKGLERIAADLPADGSGSLAWDEAVAALGQEDRLDALIAVGLLQTAGRRVRFAYEQLAEPLRPVPADPVPGLEGIDGRTEPDLAALQRIFTALLRLEANGEDAAFACGIVALLDRIDRLGTDLANSDEVWAIEFYSGYLPLAEGADRMARALPRCRSEEIRPLYVLLARRPQIFSKRNLIETLTRWLAEAPLPADERARLLLTIAPWHDAWPWRLKDWEDSQRRLQFAGTIENSVDSIGHRLNALLVENLAAVGPVLVSGVTNNTLIKHGYSSSNSRRKK